MKILKNSIHMKKQKIINAFDDMIAYMLSNKKHNPLVTDLISLFQKILD